METRGWRDFQWGRAPSSKDRVTGGSSARPPDKQFLLISLETWFPGPAREIPVRAGESRGRGETPRFGSLREEDSKKDIDRFSEPITLTTKTLSRVDQESSRHWWLANATRLCAEGCDVPTEGPFTCRGLPLKCLFTVLCTNENSRPVVFDGCL